MMTKTNKAAPPSVSTVFSDERDVLLKREEAASYLQVSVPTLENWAREGKGPRCTKVGRGVRYRLADLRAYTSR
jgi:excisionase family DNA binding protein